MGFLNKVEYVPVADGVVELTSPLCYLAESGEVYWIPVGYQSDGFSIPWAFHWFHGPFDEGVESAFFHDFLLDAAEHDHLSFMQANNLFVEALESQGIGWFKRKVLGLGTDLNALIVHQNDNPDPAK